MQNRYQLASFTSREDVLECAFALADQDFNHLEPDFKDSFTEIVIDTHNREFFITNPDGLRIAKLIAETRDDEKFTTTNLKTIQQWPLQKKKIQA